MSTAVERALRILDLVGRTGEPAGTSEIARRLRLPKSTAHGLLRSLVAAGALEDVGKRYRLGPYVSRLAAAPELRRRWRPALELLASETGETAFVGQHRGSRLAVVDEVLGAGAPVMSAPAGSSLPAWAGAVGQVLRGSPSGVDLGGYLEGVNAAAVAIPGGVLWVAGFAARLDAGRTERLERRLLELARSNSGKSAPPP